MVLKLLVKEREKIRVNEWLSMALFCLKANKLVRYVIVLNGLGRKGQPVTSFADPVPIIVSE